MHREPRYNLVDESWIPVLRKDGTQDFVGLAELFSRAGEIADLAVRPHERVALMRLLLSLCYAVMDNGSLKRDELATKVTGYLQQWRDSFWLYHPERPFLQIAGLKPNKEDTITPFSKLDFALSSGNNAMLFDHVGERARPDTKALAMALLSYQCFSPGGLISQVRWRGVETSKSSTDAPCIASSMLHVFIRGKDLADTLWLNIVPLRDLKRIYGYLGEGWFGRPYWEKLPEHREHKEAVDNATKTFLGRLVPLSRAVLLRENGMLHGEALSYPIFDDFPAEPTATVYLQTKGKKQEKKLLPFRPNKAVWRELSAVLVANTVEFETYGVRGPLSLRVLCDQAFETWEYEIIADGIARTPGQMDIIDTIESIYPLRRRLLTDEGQRDYQAGVQEAENMSSRLAYAVSTFREQLDGSWLEGLSRAGKDKQTLLEKLHRQAMLIYWGAVEQKLSLLFDMASSTEQKEFLHLNSEWKKFIWSEALKAYDLVCGELSGRHEQAYIRGRSKLMNRKDKKEGTA